MSEEAVVAKRGPYTVDVEEGKHIGGVHVVVVKTNLSVMVHIKELSLPRSNLWLKKQLK